MSDGVSWATGAIIGATVLAASSIVAIVYSSLALRGLASLKTVCISSLATSIINPITIIPNLITSSLGLAGRVSIQVVSKVSLAFSALSLAVALVGYVWAGCVCHYDR